MMGLEQEPPSTDVRHEVGDRGGLTWAIGGPRGDRDGATHDKQITTS
jgi:hypothetical protein